MKSAAEFLRQISDAEATVHKLETRLFHLRMLATDNAHHMNGPVGHGQADQDKTGTLAAEICDTEQELRKAQESAVRIREEVGRMICRIEDEKIQKVMMKRYIQGMKWSEIAGDMMYSEQWIYELGTRGIEEMERLIGKEQR